MASSSRAGVEKTPNENIFISWKEKVVNESNVGRRIEFFLQLKNFKWVLAVIGVLTNQHHMEFTIDPNFYWHYGKDTTDLGKGVWKRRCDVAAWLEAQISSAPFTSAPFNDNNEKMLSDEGENICQVMDAGNFSTIINNEGAKASLAFPSGYNHAYSIPSRAQMVLKHGGRKFDVAVEDGYLTQGWNYFVSEHEIQQGYVVKFHFVGCSTYEIEIFDRKRSKKVYPWSNLEYHEWF